MILDHVGFRVADFAKSRAFYAAAGAPLGLALVQEGEGWAMLGKAGKPAFWFGSVGGPAPEGDLKVHLAFAADSREQVGRFHAAALAAGGRDNGGPGLRPQYHPSYYGAFVLDPDGHNIEAVCHRPEG